MKIAVLTLTRDRLPYTQHCFGQLRELAGCEFDHYVIDQGSADATVEWLDGEMRAGRIALYCPLDENIGISRGMNAMMTWLDGDNTPDYDVVVKFDNDCELVTPGGLRDVCRLALHQNAIFSPTIHGIGHAPPDLGTTMVPLDIDKHWRIEWKQYIGGIFMAIPRNVFEHGWRWNDDAPTWGTDDEAICAFWQGKNLAHGPSKWWCGYVADVLAYHYKTTEGQEADIPWYFERAASEGAP